jgi:small-conductance mechanosensitive channel
VAPPENVGERLLAYLLGVIAAAILLVGLFALVAYLDPKLWAADAIYIYAGAAVLLGYLFARAVGSSIQRYLNRYGQGHHAPAAKLLFDIAIATIVVAVMLHLIGVPVESIFFGSAFAGIILGLAGQTVLANVFAGLLIIFAAPFRPGERVSLLSTSFGTIWPTYPREMTYATLTGTIADIGYFYTTLQLDSGRATRVPNSVVIQALVVDLTGRSPHAQRVRVTLPQSTPPSVLTAAVQEYDATHPALPGAPKTRVEVADIQPATWDGVITVWTMNPVEETVRDEVLKVVLPRVAAAAATTAAAAAAASARPPPAAPTTGSGRTPRSAEPGTLSNDAVAPPR